MNKIRIINICLAINYQFDRHRAKIICLLFFIKLIKILLYVNKNHTQDIDKALISSAIVLLFFSDHLKDLLIHGNITDVICI